LIVRYVCFSIPFFDPLTLARNTLPAFPEQLFGSEMKPRAGRPSFPNDRQANKIRSSKDGTAKPVDL
jgi:hypothetical protein